MDKTNERISTLTEYIDIKKDIIYIISITEVKIRNTLTYHLALLGDIILKEKILV